MGMFTLMTGPRIRPGIWSSLSFVFGMALVTSRAGHPYVLEFAFVAGIRRLMKTNSVET